MITANQLKTLTTASPLGLAKFLANSGYTGCSFKSAEFLGITNAGQFCYSVKFFDEGGGPGDELQDGKVFLEFNHATGAVKADF